LFFDGTFILAKDVGAAAGLDFASLQIEQKFDLPRRKGVPRRLAALHLCDEPPETAKHDLPFFQVIVSGHVGLIGGGMGML
jgi:hypothetical protein